MMYYLTYLQDSWVGEEEGKLVVHQHSVD